MAFIQFQFLEEAQDAEHWMEEQSEMLERNYNRTDFSLEDGERYLRELDEIKVGGDMSLL